VQAELEESKQMQPNAGKRERSAFEKPVSSVENLSDYEDEIE